MDEENELEDVLSEVDLPVYDEENLEKVKQLQDDEELRHCIRFLKGEEEMPNKIEALNLPNNIKKFLFHVSNFKMTNQGVLIRLWTHENGKIKPLVVVGQRQI